MGAAKACGRRVVTPYERSGFAPACCVCFRSEEDLACEPSQPRCAQSSFPCRPRRRGLARVRLGDAEHGDGGHPTGQRRASERAAQLDEDHDECQAEGRLRGRHVHGAAQGRPGGDLHRRRRRLYPYRADGRWPVPLGHRRGPRIHRPAGAGSTGPRQPGRRPALLPLHHRRQRLRGPADRRAGHGADQAAERARRRPRPHAAPRHRELTGLPRPDGAAGRVATPWRHRR